MRQIQLVKPNMSHAHKWIQLVCAMWRATLAIWTAAQHGWGCQAFKSIMCLLLPLMWNIWFSAMDALVQVLMKDIVKCAKHCDLQNSESQQNVEWGICFQILPGRMPSSVLYCLCWICFNMCSMHLWTSSLMQCILLRCSWKLYIQWTIEQSFQNWSSDTIYTMCITCCKHDVGWMHLLNLSI